MRTKDIWAEKKNVKMMRIGAMKKILSITLHRVQ
jgi:hypothetical protein